QAWAGPERRSFPLETSVSLVAGWHPPMTLMHRAARMLRRKGELRPRRPSRRVQFRSLRPVLDPIGYPRTAWVQEVAADEDEHLVLGALPSRDGARIARAVVRAGRRVAAPIVGAPRTRRPHLPGRARRGSTVEALRRHLGRAGDHRRI